ncbi:hypothetical protein ACFWGC_28550 [Cytobacillus pseudoceanisediminis]|uniref:hypothetical protein n=1 Tax=Cytobacillus pseudoceanisediminis TaxID=3051614 RepID=UPI0036533BBD
MYKKILAFIVLTFLVLVGCADGREKSPMASIKKEMEEALGADIVIPNLDGYQINYAEIQNPPVFEDKPLGDSQIATITYTKNRGKLVELTDKQKEAIENANERKILFGEFEGERLVTLEVSNYEVMQADSETKKIEGIPVDYIFKESEDGGRFEFFAINLEGVSYVLTVTPSDDNDPLELVKSVIRQIKQ